MSDKDAFAWLSGQLRGMLDLCLAMLITHPNPKEVRRLFEKMMVATAAQIEAGGLPEKYQAGLKNISSEVAKVLAELDAIDQLQVAKPEGVGH